MRVYLKVGPLVQDVDEGFSVHHQAPLLPGPRRVLGLVQVQPDGQPGVRGGVNVFSHTFSLFFIRGVDFGNILASQWTDARDSRYRKKFTTRIRNHVSLLSYQGLRKNLES